MVGSFLDLTLKVLDAQLLLCGSKNYMYTQNRRMKLITTPKFPCLYDFISFLGPHISLIFSTNLDTVHFERPCLGKRVRA
jgi:hypothetical protein